MPLYLGHLCSVEKQYWPVLTRSRARTLREKETAQCKSDIVSFSVEMGHGTGRRYR